MAKKNKQLASEDNPVTGFIELGIGLVIFLVLMFLFANSGNLF